MYCSVISRDLERRVVFTAALFTLDAPLRAAHTHAIPRSRCTYRMVMLHLILSSAGMLLANDPKAVQTCRRAFALGLAQCLSLAQCPPPAFAAVQNPDRLAADAAAAFQRGDYSASESMWREYVNVNPRNEIGLANFATVCIINASDEMKLGMAPEGRAKERLDEALRAIDQAKAVASSADPLLLNAQGNALGLSLRWEEARAAYSEATAASPRDFESIPRSNEALALFELGSLAEAEKTTRTLLRRDPGFRDGRALLAALRFEQSDRAGAATAVGELCDGAGGSMWCRRYSTVDVVLGRWTPKAVDAYRRLLAEPSIALEFRNAEAPRQVREEYIPRVPL